MTGAPLLPGPGSYLEQDAELMDAFDMLAEVWPEVEKATKPPEQNEEQTSQ